MPHDNMPYDNMPHNNMPYDNMPYNISHNNIPSNFTTQTNILSNMPHNNIQNIPKNLHHNVSSINNTISDQQNIESINIQTSLPSTIDQNIQPIISQNIQPTVDQNIQPTVDQNIQPTENYVGDYSVPTNKDDNPLDPKMWGPHAWKFMEAMVFNYPENPTKKEKDAAIKFFDSLMILLPCEKCRKHYVDNRKKRKIDVTNKDKFTKWFISFHNDVNSMLGKKQFNYNEIASKYTEECESCKL